jgi:hypothetical protein
MKTIVYLFFTLLLIAGATSCATMGGRSPQWPGTISASTCRITALDGHYKVAGSKVLVSTDAKGNPIHAMGEVKISFPDSIPDGTYFLTVNWQTGTMKGTPWAYRLGSDAGTVTENGEMPNGEKIVSGEWHYFYPGHAGDESNQSYSHDLAGPNPVEFSMWPNSPVAAGLTVAGIGPGDFFIRLRDLSPAENDYFKIKSFVLSPAPETSE